LPAPIAGGCAGRGVEIRLANAPAQVWLPLELSGLGKVFEVTLLPSTEV
jgi:hypothetical protein